jgi:twitching motility protein PilT
METLLRTIVEMKASDLHLSVSSLPLVRHDGEIRPIEGRGVLTNAETERLIFSIMPARNREEFERRNDTDFAYEILGLSRFRCNAFRDRKGVGGVFRQIPNKILTAEDMGLPKELLQLCYLPKGLILVTGPTGSGKSTTLCALIDYINRNRSDHVITIEDPLEFVHENKKCLVNQRQVGEHTDSFKDALRAALREDPDVVLVGEMRDLETVAIAIETAETGHLVFGTLHTSSAASTVDRIVDQFPADRQSQVRIMLSESLKAVICQMLCKKIGGGRVPAMEVLIGIPSVANLIRESKTFQLPSMMQTGKKYGMVLMNDTLTDLVKRKVVEPQEAYAKATDKPGLLGNLKKNNIDVSWAPTEI